MGYQAVLFCPDEKLARVISQVFNEVDFTVDVVTEPFTTVKKLMAQHYDAIVIDCESDQNSALLFKSGRNSSCNQNALAIAVVEGQAGVAKAYRIGANLVLTKPINLEQAKGTLRVARGLLRKNADTAVVARQEEFSKPGLAGAAAGFDSRPTVAGAAAGRAAVDANHAEVAVPLAAAPNTTTPQAPTLLAKVNEVPAASMSATLAKPPAVGAPLKASAPTEGNIAGESITASESPKPEETASAGQKGAANAPTGAAAPAPAKEAAKAEQSQEAAVEKIPGAPAPAAENDTIALQPVPSFAAVAEAPSFASFGEGGTEGAGSRKKIAIAVVILLALATAGYFVWNKVGAPAKTPHSTTLPGQPQDLPKAGLAPVVTPTDNQKREKVVAASMNANTSPGTVHQKSPAASPERIRLDLDSTAKNSGAAPLRVKAAASTAATTKTEAEDATVQPPSLLAVNSPANDNLSGLLTSDTGAAKPSLAEVKISQGVSQGLLIKRVEPRYSAAALSSHAQGTVEIEATIDREGNVVNPKVLKGDRILAAAALDAVRQWRYKPYYLNGQPVEIQTQITIKFKGN